MKDKLFYDVQKDKFYIQATDKEVIKIVSHLNSCYNY